ncbi:arginase family protein [bacterium]|nr:arginase family protein [bacterium]
MSITRREFVTLSATLLAANWLHAVQPNAKKITIVLAPSNLGLRPNDNGSEPGTWKAPQVLIDAGLKKALNADEVIALDRPRYEYDAQAGTRIRNGNTIRAFSLQLSEKINEVLKKNQFPVVIGGDCSILLGGLYASRLAGGRGLVHIDGHADFSHPGNYDAASRLGSVAGMDLALASGRGEELLTDWPKIGKPLASDADIIQIGERNAESPNYKNYYGDILRTEIRMFKIQSILADGIKATAQKAIARLQERGLNKVWTHVDLDVLDEAVMSAVDSPGSPGLNYAQLSELIAALCNSNRISGINFAIYDPERDSGLRYAQPLVKCIADGLSNSKS